jgi:hypothetical protein
MTTQSPDYQDVLKRVRSWQPELRLTLAEEVLRSLHPLSQPASQTKTSL